MAWKRNFLVVANVTATSDELLDVLKERAARAPAAFTLIVPATHFGGGRAAAAEQLGEAVERMRDAGLEIEGRVGDADAMVAVTESWDPKRYDEIIFSTLPTGLSKWLQADLPHRVAKLTGALVVHVVSGPPKPGLETVRVLERGRYGLLTPLVALGGPSRRAGGGRARKPGSSTSRAPSAS
ncbi:MAG: hypothetical protein M3071_12740 [Actinomycetota bacterium]|nr:hypothetical protein [Actinomycetota bacterium]